MAPRKLREPCMDRNPWPAERGMPEGSPCGRPKGHKTGGGRGAQWGVVGALAANNTHAERPGPDDPPTRTLTKHIVWVPEGCRIIVMDPE